MNSALQTYPAPMQHNRPPGRNARLKGSERYGTAVVHPYWSQTRMKLTCQKLKSRVSRVLAKPAGTDGTEKRSGLYVRPLPSPSSQINR